MKIIEKNNMQVPIRKPGKFTHTKLDQYITEDKYIDLQNNLEKLNKTIRPRLIEEVQRLALMGDFSENAAYQIAKGRLRGINQRMLDIEDLLKRAVIIKHQANNDIVKIGHIVTTETAGKQRTYQILGSSETDPSGGVISHISPIGSALIGKKTGDIVMAKINGREIEYRIIRIE